MTGLSNHFSARLLKDGSPWSGPVSGPLVPAGTMADDDGVFVFAHQSRITPAPLGFHVAGAVLEVPIEFRTSGVRLDLPEGPFVRPGRDLAVLVDSLPLSVPLKLDLWVGDVLSYGALVEATGSPQTLRVPMPHDYLGLGRVEIYRALPAAPHKVPTHGLWFSNDPPETAAQRALAALRPLADPDDPLFAGVAPSVTLATLALGRIRATEPGMPLLISSMAARRAAVKKEVAEKRRLVHLLMGALVLLGLLQAWAYILRHRYDVRRKMREVHEDALAEGDDLTVPRTPTLERLLRLHHGAEGTLAVAVVVATGYAAWLLFTHLSWSFSLLGE